MNSGITVEQIAKETGLNRRFLLLLSNNIPDYYRMYRIPNKNGKFRTIEAPAPVLKRIQQYILWRILPRRIPCSPEELADTAEILKGNNISFRRRKNSLLFPFVNYSVF